jgi:hypothetical protein
MIIVNRSSSLEFTADQSVVISLRALFLEQRERHVSCDAHKQHMIIVGTKLVLCVHCPVESVYSYHHVNYNFNYTYNCGTSITQVTLVQLTGTTTFNTGDAPML